jgi:signal transduction histidine kinase
LSADQDAASGTVAASAIMSFEEIEHELRTPLASIRSLSEIMRDYPDLSPEQRQRFLDLVLLENERLARTVERLLDSPALQEGVG